MTPPETPDCNRDAPASFAGAHGSAIDPACGTGGFLASALGLWFTPQHVLDFLEGKPTANPDAILGNPPFGTESPNDPSSATRLGEGQK